MTIDDTLARGLAIALIAAAVSPLLLRAGRRESLWLIGLPAAVAYFRSAFPGFLLVVGLAHLVAHALGAVTNAARRWRWTTRVLALLIATFMAGRLGSWDRPLLFSPGGWPVVLCTLDMWLALRVVTLVWEVGSGKISPPPFGALLGWLCFPMTLGGPLLRYSELPQSATAHPEVWRSGAWWADLGSGSATLAGGLLLGMVPPMLANEDPGARLAHGAALVLIAGPIGFYLTFAGYFQLMQTLARVTGIVLPDSFNWPLGRENISEFWANWNMTATRVFRDYLFYSRWLPRRHNVYLNTLVLFTLVGLWHGANGYWLLWGVLHGVMFCAFLAWRKWNAARGRRGLAATGTAADIAGRMVTYLGVCLAWYLPSKILQWLGVV